METENQVGNELNDSQIDSLIEGQGTSRDIPMTAPQSPQATPWVEDVFKAGGKEVKGTREQILKWAQMGYEYPQKAQEWNKSKQQLESYLKREQELKDREQKWAAYDEVDQFATKNPNWWAKVQEQYRQELAGATSNPEIAQLKSEFQELKEWRNQQLQEKQSLKIKEEDTALSAEVDSIRKTYPNIDFDTPDEEGWSLEMKVLKHAEDSGIKSFKTAFRDYYHDQLISKAEEKGKETVSKTIQKNTKLGILGESPKPTKGLKVATDYANMSYEDLKREALEELGLA